MSLSMSEYLSAEFGIRMRRGHGGVVIVESVMAPRPSVPSGLRKRPSISPRLRARVFARDGFQCRRCGHGRDDGARLALDHVVPVARGGASDESNLQTLCSDCNAGKSDSFPHTHDLRGLSP